MASPSRAPSLGRRFLLLVLVGAVLPLGAIGLWVTQGAARSGRQLLESQLHAQLTQATLQVEQRWTRLRSDLLMLGENEPIRLLLLGTDSATTVPPFVHRAFGQMDAFQRVIIRDARGRARVTLQAAEEALVPERRSGAAGSDIRGAGPGLPVRVPLTDLATGDTIGVLEAAVRVAALLPAATQLAARDGPLTAVFGSAGGSAIPAGADARLFSDERVEWEGQRWLTVRRALTEPPIEVAIAGALDPYVAPFERAAARAAAILMTAALLVALLVGVLIRRITRRVERELAQREALAAVGEFASELAHEVRNPLTAIRLDLQRMEEQAAEPESVHGVVPRVLRQIDRLDRAVSGALRVARGGSVEAHRLDLREVLEGARRGAEPEFRQRGARLGIAVAGGEALHVDGDAGALEQLFLNLLINAAQSLSTNGEARVEAARRNGHVEVTIVDTGVGMTASQLEDVEQPFRSTRRDGTGLGLKIARRIVATHRGEMEMRSSPGAGTTVLIRLPAG